jgi:AAA ATPase domain
MAQWPLVGRREELSQLTDAVVGQRGAVITGPAGTGKTTLALTGLGRAQARGMRLARVAATRASRDLPFGAFASVLPAELQGRRLRSEDRSELLRRYARALIEGGGGRPLVVFVDDAHLLDGGSATLLHQLALTRAATAVATVRSGEAAPDPVLSLWKDGPAERIEVGVLDAAEIEELLVSALGGPVDAAAVRQLADRCQGNPLFLRELVTGALETGALADAGGIWRLGGSLRPTARLAELVALRLGDLSWSERAVLELLTLGEPLGSMSLARLTDPAAVDSLERKGLITSQMNGRRVEVRLAHPIYGEVVRTGISVLRERALARSRAEVIEATAGRRREDILRLAAWRLVGGGGSAGLLVSGAMAARGRHDHSLAERLARAAVDAGAGFEARFVAAEAAHFQGRSGEAEYELAASPRTRAATTSGAASRCSASTTRICSTAELTISSSTTRSLSSPTRSGATNCWTTAPSSRPSPAGPGPRWVPDRPCPRIRVIDRTLPRTQRSATPWSGPAASTRPSSYSPRRRARRRSRQPTSRGTSGHFS